jgi:hypothetical protein
VPSPASYQRRRARGASDLLPPVDRDAVALEHLALLPEDHELRAVGHRVRHAPDRVDERAEVGLVAVGQRVEARAHRAVRRLEHAQVRLAARAQQRVVGALVELDLVAEAPRSSSVGLATTSLDTTKNYSFTYGTPMRRAVGIGR